MVNSATTTSPAGTITNSPAGTITNSPAGTTTTAGILRSGIMPNSEIDQLKRETVQLIKQPPELRYSAIATYPTTTPTTTTSSTTRTDYVPWTLTHFIPLFLGLMIFGFLVDFIGIGMDSWTNFAFGALVMFLQLKLNETIFNATKKSNLLKS